MPAASPWSGPPPCHQAHFVPKTIELAAGRLGKRLASKSSERAHGTQCPLRCAAGTGPPPRKGHCVGMESPLPTAAARQWLLVKPGSSSWWGLPPGLPQKRVLSSGALKHCLAVINVLGTQRWLRCAILSLNYTLRDKFKLVLEAAAMACTPLHQQRLPRRRSRSRMNRTQWKVCF